MTFKPALVIVDVQEDFCPPDGSLAVQDGRDIVPTINELLSLPFPLKIATKDFHPLDHISFASNHEPPNNKPFESVITIQNPLNPQERQETRLWPNHCVQGTKGSELLPELDLSKIHQVVEKGQDKRVEMYSAFADPFINPNVSHSSLAQMLRDAQITDVFIAGLAADYCVKFTALDAQKEGFKTWVVSEATKPVDPSALTDVYKEYDEAGVAQVSKEDTIQRVRNYS
ncbi:Isochorismatase-like protein [Dendryphion nanum]|uniref:nicotinamidase n=1 Tax=Dendryphion nanum TaxID=256645 RepID=A0A9P9II84_9PLEO|nr:Isochorismatase-like protein [Dendryphion nanum]